LICNHQVAGSSPAAGTSIYVKSPAFMVGLFAFRHLKVQARSTCLSRIRG
jgi:hypothetical protein